MAHSLGLNVVAEGVEDRGAARCSCASTAATRSRATGCRRRWTRTAAWRFIRTWAPDLNAAVMPVSGAATCALTTPRTLPIVPLMDTRRLRSPSCKPWPRASTSWPRSRSGWPTRTAACASQEQLVGERAQLLAKNEQARSRVEAMITRLKSLEQHT